MGMVEAEQRAAAPDVTRGRQIQTVVFSAALFTEAHQKHIYIYVFSISAVAVMGESTFLS